jgi:hypothetical protein
MKFNLLVKEIMEENNILTYKSLREALTSKHNLTISIRHFQTICSGNSPPTPSLITALFSFSQDHFRKKIIASFIFEQFASEPNSDEVINFINDYLKDSIPLPKQALFKKNNTENIYNTDQLEYLLNNSTALKLYHKILLKDEIKRPTNISERIIENLVNLELVKTKGEYLLPRNQLMLIPSRKNSDQVLTSIGIKFLLKIVDLYLVNGDIKNQIVEGAILTVPKSLANPLLEEFESFYRNLKKVTTASNDKESIPLAFSGFMRIIDWKDL